MKAKEARKLYFEKYVFFETFIKELASKNIKNYSSRFKKLNIVIDDLLTLINFEKRHKKTLLKKQLRVRNWLAHQNANTTVPNSYLLLMRKIDQELKEISDWKIKKQNNRISSIDPDRT